MADRSVGIEGGDIPVPIGVVIIGCEVTAVKVEFNMHEIGMESHTHARTHAHTHTRTRAHRHDMWIDRQYTIIHAYAQLRCIEADDEMSAGK